MIRLIATDLDGTLLEKGGALPEGFYDVAEDLKKLGILLVAASGRQYDNLRRKFQPIAREMGFVCENGGLNAVGREIVSIHPMDRAAALGITQTLQGLGLSILLSGVRCCYTLASDRPFCDGMVYTLRNTMTIVDDFSQIDDDFIKLAAYHPGTIDPFMDKLQSKWGSAVNVARSGEEWCDFNLSNKGMGLKDLMRTLNISPAEAAAFTLLKEQLMSVLSTLTPREEMVLKLRFGLEDGRARTLEEVGKEFKVTRERIRQIEAKALRKLRHPSRSKKLRDYLD